MEDGVATFKLETKEYPDLCVKTDTEQGHWPQLPPQRPRSHGDIIRNVRPTHLQMEGHGSRRPRGHLCEVSVRPGRHPCHRPAPPSTLLIAPHQAYSRHSHPRAETLSLLSDPALRPLYASSHHRLLLSVPAVQQLGRDEWPSVPDFCLRARCSATVEPILFFADFVKSKEVSQKHCSGDLGVLDGRVSVTEVSPAIVCLLSGLAYEPCRTRPNICSRMTFLGRWSHLDNWLSSPNGAAG